MAYKYTLIECIYIDGGTKRIAYGIAVLDHGDLGAVVQAIPDLSADSDTVEQLVCLCNDLQLDPVHLEDVVDDFLANI